MVTLDQQIEELENKRQELLAQAEREGKLKRKVDSYNQQVERNRSKIQESNDINQEAFDLFNKSKFKDNFQLKSHEANISPNHFYTEDLPEEYLLKENTMPRLRLYSNFRNGGDSFMMDVRRGKSGDIEIIKSDLIPKSQYRYVKIKNILKSMGVYDKEREETNTLNAQMEKIGNEEVKKYKELYPEADITFGKVYVSNVYDIKKRGYYSYRLNIKFPTGNYVLIGFYNSGKSYIINSYKKPTETMPTVEEVVRDLSF